MGVLEHSEKLEKELTPEPVIIPATGAMILHTALLGGVVLYALLAGLLRHSTWGDVDPGSAMNASIVSSALPLPSDQPVNDNVLPTDNPSTAPAPPEPKTTTAEDKTATPISDKVKTPDNTPQQKTQQQAKTDNKASFGEQTGSAIARSTSPDTIRGPLKLSNADFASKFGWYADGISRKMIQNTYKNEVDASTPAGSVAEIHFRVNREGVPSSFKLITPSPSQTLNTACMRAAQRIDTFGRLPPESNDQWLDVTYDCKY
jgi:periplasmic protein TonB